MELKKCFKYLAVCYCWICDWRYSRYLFMTESGRKLRYAVSHPDELADTIEDARSFIDPRPRW